MDNSAMVLHPESFVGFNKTQLIERHLLAAGVIGSRFKSSPFFSAGHNFRRFVPKVDSIHKYHYGLIRIEIQAVGVRMNASVITDCSNLVLVEGDALGYPLERYSALRDFLTRITGDQYEVGVLHDLSIEPVSEPEVTYRTTAILQLAD